MRHCNLGLDICIYDKLVHCGKSGGDMRSVSYGWWSILLECNVVDKEVCTHRFLGKETTILSGCLRSSDFSNVDHRMADSGWELDRNGLD